MRRWPFCLLIEQRTLGLHIRIGRPHTSLSHETHRHSDNWASSLCRIEVGPTYHFGPHLNQGGSASPWQHSCQRSMQIVHAVLYSAEQHVPGTGSPLGSHQAGTRAVLTDNRQSVPAKAFQHPLLLQFDVLAISGANQLYTVTTRSSHDRTAIGLPAGDLPYLCSQQAAAGATNIQG